MTNNNYPALILLGSTGSIGEQAVDVAGRLGVRVAAIAAVKNVRRTEEQARQFKPVACALADNDAAKDLRVRLADTDIKIYSGSEGINDMIRETDEETAAGQMVLNAITGEAGLPPTLKTLECGKRLALANKESLVVAGNIVMRTAAEHGIEILPVDSEHCAIFQCLRAGNKNEIKKILLTASGGPFFGYNKEKLGHVTLKDTLAHPTWKMGAGITVNSATLMNKGFEVIEAVHLFGVAPDRIQVVIQRESIIHSMVEYIDNSIVAQMSVPDMRHCIQYALTHPGRDNAVTDELDLIKLGKLTFSEPDTENFPLLPLAVDAIKRGGALPAAVNAANEEAVGAFLTEKIRFCDIHEIVIRVAGDMQYAAGTNTLSGILACDRDARERARKLIYS